MDSYSKLAWAIATSKITRKHEENFVFVYLQIIQDTDAPSYWRRRTIYKQMVFHNMHYTKTKLFHTECVLYANKRPSWAIQKSKLLGLWSFDAEHWNDLNNFVQQCKYRCSSQVHRNENRRKYSSLITKHQAEVTYLRLKNLNLMNTYSIESPPRLYSRPGAQIRALLVWVDALTERSSQKLQVRIWSQAHKTQAIKQKTIELVYTLAFSVTEKKNWTLLAARTYNKLI